jgi:hypothetical protein
VIDDHGLFLLGDISVSRWHPGSRWRLVPGRCVAGSRIDLLTVFSMIPRTRKVPARDLNWNAV